MIRRAMLTAVLAACIYGVSGCTKPAVREKPLADPLLTSKKPIEGKQHMTASMQSFDELPPPPAPPAGFRR